MHEVILDELARAQEQKFMESSEKTEKVTSAAKQLIGKSKRQRLDRTA